MIRALWEMGGCLALTLIAAMLLGSIWRAAAWIAEVVT